VAELFEHPRPSQLDRLAAEISVGLHDLCQPLSTLQCRLEIGMIDGTPNEMSAAITDALNECTKLNNQVREMQLKVARPNHPAKGN
jgi:hypothetical protein